MFFVHSISALEEHGNTNEPVHIYAYICTYLIPTNKLCITHCSNLSGQKELGVYKIRVSGTWDIVVVASCRHLAFLCDSNNLK
jgi:hypothetical protein